MFDNVAAFEGDSTTIKIFPLSVPVTFTAVDFLAAVFFVVAFFVALVFVVLVLAAEAVFAVFFVLASVVADDFLDAGIVITPVLKIFSCNYILQAVIFCKSYI